MQKSIRIEMQLAGAENMEMEVKLLALKLLL